MPIKKIGFMLLESIFIKNEGLGMRHEKITAFFDCYRDVFISFRL